MCAAILASSEPFPETAVLTGSGVGVPGPKDWHALDTRAVAASLAVDLSVGLSTTKVNERQVRYGRNALQEVRPRSAWNLIVDQFTSLVIALLAVAAAIAWLTGDQPEAIAILIVLVINAAVGFVTEWQAGRALDALRRQTRTSSRVRRDGFETTVGAEELVPGDIVILNPGDRVPADCPLLEAVRLETEESALTGESTTVEKTVVMWALERYGPGAHSRTVALFALVGVQLGHTFNCRSRSRSALNEVFRNPFIWIATVMVVLLQLLAAYFTPLAFLLGTVEPLAVDWTVIVVCTLLTVGIVRELARFLQRVEYCVTKSHYPARLKLRLRESA